MYRRQSPASQHDRQVSNCQLAKRRAGLITFWALVTIPVFLTMLCVILEVGNLWAARIQLKNALEAAALAGVQEWGDQVIANPAMKDTMASRTTAIAYAGANVVNGAPVVLLANYNGANTNQNNDCTIITDADLVFGTTEVNGSNEYVFNAALSDGCGVNANPTTTFFAVRAQTTMAVPSICDTLFGFAIGNFDVTARVDALYDCATTQPRIYHLDQDVTHYICPGP